MIAIAPSFENLLAESFDQIRRSAEGNVAIMTHDAHARHASNHRQPDNLPAPQASTPRTYAVDWRTGRSQHRIRA